MGSLSQPSKWEERSAVVNAKRQKLYKLNPMQKRLSNQQSRLTIVSREAKKKQRPLSELFTWTTTKKLGNAQAKPP